MGTVGRLGRAMTLISLILVGVSLVSMPSRASSGPALTVSPATGLVDPTGDGQFVRLSWTGLPPDLAPVMRQCSAHPHSVHDCSQSGLSGPGAITPGNPTPDGSGSTIVAVKIGLVNATISGTATKDSFTCDYRHPCTMALFLDTDAVDVRHAVLAPITFAFPPSACPAPSGTPVGGVGAGSAFRAMLAWEASACRKPYNLFAQYTLQSAPIAAQDFASGTASFGVVTDALPPLQQGILEGKGQSFTYAPVSESALVLGIRLFDRVTDEQITNLKLTPDLVVELMTGQITWNDPAVLALNPQYVDANGIGTLPTSVKPVGRGDACEETRAFTTWAWRNARDAWIQAGEGLPNVDHNPFTDGPTDLFPSVALGKPELLQGSRAVAKEVANPSQDAEHNFGYIGYMDSSWAASYGLAPVQIENPSGNFVAPTPRTIRAGVSHMQINEDGITRDPDFNTTDPAAYPIPTVSYMLVHTAVTDAFTADQGTTLQKFLQYVVGPGQHHLPVGYVRLSRRLAKLGRKAAASIPVASDLTTTSTSVSVSLPSFTTPPSTITTSGATATATPSPVERGPVIPPTTLPETTPSLRLPGVLTMGLSGLAVGPALMWNDRRRRRRPEKPPSTKPPRRKRRAKHAAPRRAVTDEPEDAA